MYVEIFRKYQRYGVKIMRIVKVNIPYNKANLVGFPPIEFDRLGDVIALVGKNGSGKSRLLNFLYESAIGPESKNYMITSAPNEDLSKYLVYVKDIEELVSNDDFEKAINDTCISDPFGEMATFIQTFLGKQLFGKQRVVGRGIEKSEVIPTYENRTFNYRELSPGEKKLFKWAVYLFKLKTISGIDTSNMIIIIDEPEINLHPDAQIGLIDGLIRMLQSSGQLWISTHSLHILSHLSYDDIYLLQNSRIYRPSKNIPGVSLYELMGVDERIGELSQFISSMSEWAYSNFILQCFLDPETIATAKADDPQVKLFKDSLINTLNEERPVAILDFGAGKGRIAKEIFDEEHLNKLFKYYAVENRNANIEVLEKLPGICGIYKDYSELGDVLFDYIIMSNVLHELHLELWEPILNKLISVLKEEGYIIFIEDKLLPRGEMPNKLGYLILDFPELIHLFGTKEIGVMHHHDERYKDRIICAVINRKHCSNIIDKLAIFKAIEELMNNTAKKLKGIRDDISNRVSGNELKKRLDGESYDLGRKYSNYSQQYINAMLALEFLKEADTNNLLANCSNKSIEASMITRKKQARKALEPIEQMSEQARKALEPIEQMSEQARKALEPIEQMSEQARKALEPIEQMSEQARMAISRPIEQMSEQARKALEPIGQMSELVRIALKPLEQVPKQIRQTSLESASQLEVAHNSEQSIKERKQIIETIKKGGSYISHETGLIVALLSTSKAITNTDEATINLTLPGEDSSEKLVKPGDMFKFKWKETEFRLVIQEIKYTKDEILIAVIHSS